MRSQCCRSSTFAFCSSRVEARKAVPEKYRSARLSNLSHSASILPVTILTLSVHAATNGPLVHSSPPSPAQIHVPATLLSDAEAGHPQAVSTLLLSGPSPLLYRSITAASTIQALPASRRSWGSRRGRKPACRSVGVEPLVRPRGIYWPGWRIPSVSVVDICCLALVFRIFI